MVGTPQTSCFHSAQVLALKKETHVYYAYFRTYFAGNVDAVDDRLRTLDATIGESAATSLTSTFSSTPASASKEETGSCSTNCEVRAAMDPSSRARHTPWMPTRHP